MKLDFEAFSRQVLDVCLGLKRGEPVWINAWEHDDELGSELALQCFKRGCPTLTTAQFDKPWKYTTLEAPTELAENLSASQAGALKEIDVSSPRSGLELFPGQDSPPRDVGF